MSFLITYRLTGKKGAQVVTKGSKPNKPTDWRASAWFILPDGEKVTHSANIQNSTFMQTVEYMHALVDSLITDHGREVFEAGWMASTHGRKIR